MSEDFTDKGELRSFAQLLANISGGDLHDRLTSAVNDLMGDIQNAAMDGGKPKGKITLTLAFALDGKMVKIVPEVKVDNPKPPAVEPTHFYVSAKNILTLNDPRQTKLNFRDINKSRDSADVRAV